MPHHTLPYQQQRPNSFLACHVLRFKPLACHVLRFKPSQTHLGQVGQVSLRQSECLCKSARVIPDTPAGVGGYPSTSGSQPDPVHAKEMLSSYRFSWRTLPILLCFSLSCKILTELFLG